MLSSTNSKMAAVPFADVQLAMDALGIDKATRPTHNRYDRLSKKLQEEIIREVK